MTDALIAKLEALQRPDKEVDYAIARHLGWTQHTDEGEQVYVSKISTWWAEPGQQWSTCSLPPLFTRSIDAAMTLVPEGHDIHMNLYFGRDGEGSAIVTSIKAIGQVRTFAPTPAIVLCIASLKARSQDNDE